MLKKPIRGPILALFCLSLGGVLLHLRIHPPGESPFNYIPLIFGIITALIVPLAFNFRRTVAWAHVFNIATVIVGTVTMAYYSARGWPSPVPSVFTLTPESSGFAATMDPILSVLVHLVLNTTLADILILAAKVPLGMHILRHFRPNGRWAPVGGPDA